MGKYLDIIRQVEEESRRNMLSLSAHQETRPDTTDRLPKTVSVSGMSGPDSTESANIQPGSRITWEGADLTVRHGVVDFLHTDADGTVWAFVNMADECWAAVKAAAARR